MVHPALVSQQVIIPQDGINVTALDPMTIIIIMVMFTITLVNLHGACQQVVEGLFTRLAPSGALPFLLNCLSKDCFRQNCFWQRLHINFIKQPLTETDSAIKNSPLPLHFLPAGAADGQEPHSLDADVPDRKT